MLAKIELNITHYIGNTITFQDYRYSYENYYIPSDKFENNELTYKEFQYRLDNDNIEVIRSEVDGDIYQVKVVKHWEFAYCKGYKPLLGNDKLKTKSWTYRATNITPRYFWEIIINSGLRAILFALYIVIYARFFKDKVTIKH